MIKISFLFCIIINLNFYLLHSSENKFSEDKNLFEMSFEDLLNVNVISSSFIAIDKIKEPASVTTITDQDILLTPYRNLYDLLEVYVPAAIWMTHYDSPHIGIRGIINQKNDKILLLVNGKNMNFKAHNGATSELENWDLSDVEKIEIIRGPGSVIYGPGAVEAIVNITTKSYNLGSNSIKLGYFNKYNSKQANLSYNFDINNDIKLYTFGSIVSTQGYYPEKGFFLSGNNNLYDLDSSYTDINPFQDFLNDSEGKPQFKFHIQLDLGKNTSFWARYTNSGTNVNGITFKMSYQTGFEDDGMPKKSAPQNFNQAKNEQFVIGFNNIYNFNSDLSLNTFISFDSENNSRSMDYIQLHTIDWAAPDNIMKMLADPKSLRNRYFACSETELLMRMLLTKQFNNDLKVAIGYEYSYNFWGQSWFNNDGYLRLGDNWNILTDKNSPAYGWKYYFGTDSNDTYLVGNGWGTNTISLFGEINYSILKDFILIGSARVDKDEYSNFMFSPRLALIYEANDFNYIKFIAQRSLRMNTAEELFIQHKKGIKPDDEQLINLELIWTRLQSTNFIINVSSFISWLDVLTWKDDIRSTILSGKLNLAGIEFETKYHNSFFDITFNHAFIKQISWNLEPGVNESGVSYSDYYKKVDGSAFTSYGNDLNNWSNNTTKLIVNCNLIDEMLVLQLNSRLYWNFQGAQDGVEMMRRALPQIKDSVQLYNLISILDKYDNFGPDFRFNSSLNFSPTQSLSFSIYGMNLINLTNNRRFKYDTGSKEQKYNYFMKNSMIIEPLTIGLSLSYKF